MSVTEKLSFSDNCPNTYKRNRAEMWNNFLEIVRKMKATKKEFSKNLRKYETILGRYLKSIQ